ncbi:MAG: Gfo/Idh/MocA family protein [Sciscionella sp.]
MKIGLIGSGRIGHMHATTLRDLDGVDGLVVADVDQGRAEDLARQLDIDAALDADAVLASGVDGVVITAATSAHAELIHSAFDAGIPTFCEKPVALDVAGTREVVAHSERSGVPLQIGFQRRFDAGYLAAREALRSGSLGWLHTLRAVTADATPPPAAYIPTSGGLFRDCGIHDFDILLWLTGRDVVSVYALGANRGADIFTVSGDVDTGAALLRFDDGALATVTLTRYNGIGHDVRLEVCGSQGAMFVGHDERAPMPSAEAGISWPSGEPYQTFMERFHDAYLAEMRRFLDVVAGRAASPCSAADALAALYVAEACERSRHEARPVELAEVRAAA